uniref:Uncharacterized protein n=1 Tax=Musa acuminata subsp. malaccensis TaxID=214687 RepID=A0A804KA77_MUSAM
MEVLLVLWARAHVLMMLLCRQRLHSSTRLIYIGESQNLLKDTV